MDTAARHPLLDAIRPAIDAIPDSQIVEIFNYARDLGLENVIRLWVGEGDRPTPSFICEAAARALAEGHTFYTHQRGIPPLRQAIADWHSTHWDTSVSPERVFVTTGGMQAIVNAVQLLAGPGDEIVIPTPAWPNIVEAIRINGGAAREVPMRFGNDGWTLDIGDLFAAVTPATRAIYVNSPSNPTGWVMSREEQIRLRDFARERGLWIVADEVYGRMCWSGGNAPSFLEIMEPEEPLLVVNTFSKNWAMTGWRLGWAVAPAPLGQKWENLIQYNTSGVAGFLQHGALAAIRDGEPLIRETVERCRRGRDIVCAGLCRASRVRMVPPAGAFYLYFAVDGIDNSRDFALRLVGETGVGLAPGTAFGADFEGWMRLCFAVSHELLEEAVDRLVPALS